MQSSINFPELEKELQFKNVPVESFAGKGKWADKFMKRAYDKISPLD